MLLHNYAESDVDLELDFEFLPFFDLDPLPDVRQLLHTLDAISEPIIVPDGFIFGDKLVTRAFVSSYHIHACMHIITLSPLKLSFSGRTTQYTQC